MRARSGLSPNLPRISRAAAIVTTLAAACFALGGCGDGEIVPANQETMLDEGVPEVHPRMAIETEYGRIDLELFPELAPRHVARVLELAASGFYDGLTFHRVVPGFLIQGGDPNTRDDDPENDGYGGLEDRRLQPEFSDRPFRRGSVGMARDYRPDGASTQFFIVVNRSPHVDEQYTLLGEVVGGMPVVDEIAGLPTDKRGRPESPPTMRVWVYEPEAEEGETP